MIKSIMAVFNLLVGLAGIVYTMTGDMQQGTWFVLLACFLSLMDMQHEQANMQREQAKMRQALRDSGIRFPKQ